MVVGGHSLSLVLGTNYLNDKLILITQHSYHTIFHVAIRKYDAIDPLINNI